MISEKTACLEDSRRSDRLTTESYWHQVWSRSQATSRTVSESITRILREPLREIRGGRLIEVGCAPGGWMAYFAKTFGMAVDGIEYVEDAASATRKNLAAKGLEGTVYDSDFFKFRPSKKYDVVFSGGFIEHFEEPAEVVRRCVSMADYLCVTIVPNLFGLNGLISRVARPQVYSLHKAIDCEMLRRMHEMCGCETLSCRYVEGGKLIYPVREEHGYRCSAMAQRLINAPFKGLNGTAEFIGNKTGIWLDTKMLSRSLIYVGRIRK